MLPQLVAGLNALCLVLLLFGWRMIRTGRKHQHRRAMTAAMAVGGLFLAAYVVEHLVFAFKGHGATRGAYYTLLISHVALAATISPIIIITFRRAATGRFDRHRALARWVMPAWVYVCASGLMVYAALHLLSP